MREKPKGEPVKLYEIPYGGFRYDRNHDTLLVRWGFCTGAGDYGDESIPGCLIIRDMKTDEVVGYEIYHFVKRFGADGFPALPFRFRYSYEQMFQHTKDTKYSIVYGI